MFLCVTVWQKRGWNCNEAGSLLNRLYTPKQIHLYKHNVKIIRFHQMKFTLLVMFQFISWIFSLMVQYLINVCPQYTKCVPTLQKLHEMSDLRTYMQNMWCTSDGGQTWTAFRLITAEPSNALWFQKNFSRSSQTWTWKLTPPLTQYHITHS